MLEINGVKNVDLTLPSILIEKCVFVKLVTNVQKKTPIITLLSATVSKIFKEFLRTHYIA